MRRTCLRFLRNLENHGFSPQTVIFDRSPLYPKAIAEVWPDANHQLCVLHVISEVNDHVLNAVGEIRRTLKPKRIKQGRGRPSKRNRARVKKLKKQREQADRLFRRRHLIVTKKSNLEHFHFYCATYPELRKQFRQSLVVTVRIALDIAL